MAALGLACGDDEKPSDSKEKKKAHAFSLEQTITTPYPIKAMAMSKINDDERNDFAFVSSKGLTIALQDEGGEFVLKPPIAVGTKPNFVLLTDLDEDGLADAVVTDTLSAKIHVLIGKGDGRFSSPAAFTVGSYPSLVLEGDLNRDSNLDLVVVNRSSNDVSVLWGNGQGQFASGLTLTVGTRPIAAELIDLNKDTFLDIVVVNESSDDLSVLMNSGEGSFEEAKNYMTGDGPTDIVLMDVDNNMLSDALVTSRNENKIYLHLGGKAGDFSESVDSNGAPFSTGEGSVALSAVDIDTDEHIDLIVSNEVSNTIQILHGDKSEVLGTRSSTTAINSPGQIIHGKIDNNDSIDVAVLNTEEGRVHLMLGKGAKKTTAPQQQILLSPTNLPDAVVNVPYRAKILTFNPQGGSISVVPTDLPAGLELFVESSTIVITGRPESAGDQMFSLVVTDEEDDKLTSTQSFTIRVYPTARGPTGKFNIATSTVSVNEPADVIIQDLDRDNHEDILVAEAAENRVTVFWGKGAGKFIVRRYPVGARPVSLASADVDQDGRADILALNMNTRDLVILKQTERQSFEMMQTINLDDGGTQIPTKLVVGDMTGDSYPDIAFLSYNNLSVSILVHTQTTTQPFAQTIQRISTESISPHVPTDLTLGDFDGDNLSDLALTNTDGDTISVLYLDTSQASFTLKNTSAAYAVGPGPVALRATHWSDDDTLDLVVVNSKSATISILNGASSGTFENAVNTNFYSGTDTFSGLAIGDFDSDSRQDFVTAGFGKNEVLIVRGDGQNGIQQTQNLPTGNGPVVVRTGDLNRDGAHDIVVANQLSGSLTILTNGSRQGQSILPVLGRPQTAAPIPNPNNTSDLVSLYSDHYTNIPVDSWAATGSMTNVSDEAVSGDNVKAYSNLDSATIDFRSNPINADRDRLTHLNLDIWAEQITGLTVKVVHRALVSSPSGGQSTSEERFEGAKMFTVGGANGLSLERWTTLRLPLRELSGLTKRTNLAEIVLTVAPSGRSIFVDNVYFDNQSHVPMQGAPAPTQAATHVRSVFSDAYPGSGPSGQTGLSFSASTNAVSYPTSEGTAYYLYNFGTAELEFQGVQDLSQMSHFHIDIFTSDATEFTIKLVDYGPDGQPDSISLGSDDSEGQVTLSASQLPHPLIRNQWYGIDIPLPDFAGLTSRTHVGKIVLMASPSSSSAFVDNIYFYRNSTLDGGILYVDGGVTPIDGGVTVIDGGVASIDGGVSPIDGGAVYIDAGLNVIDGGVQVTDGGQAFVDGGVGYIIGGFLYIDGGALYIDGGVILIDGGVTPVDGGVELIDGGVVPIDGGVEIIDGGVDIIDGGVTPIDGGVEIIDGGVSPIDGGLEIIDGGVEFIDGGVQSINCTDDRFEDNDSDSVATLLTAGTYTLLRSCLGDEDYYEFSLNAGATITATISFSHAEGDLDLELWDSSGTQLLFSNSSNDNESITYTTSTPGNYRLRAFMFQERGSLVGNDYQLVVSY